MTGYGTPKPIDFEPAAVPICGEFREEVPMKITVT
jgi:hypothetical protein